MNSSTSPSSDYCMLWGNAPGIFSLLLVLFAFLVCPIRVHADELENIPDYEYMEEENEYSDDSDSSLDGYSSVSDGDAGGPVPEESEMEYTTDLDEYKIAETIVSYLAAPSLEENIYTDLSEFENSPAIVDRFQYELIKRLEYLQYSCTILIALIFILIFRKK